MKLLKNVMTFTVPLSIMLLIFSTYIVVNSVVKNYKDSITNDYIIIVTAKNPISDMKRVANIDVKSVEMLDQDNIIKNVESSLSQSTVQLLNKNLPLFYKVSLVEFPTKEQLIQIRKELESDENIKSTEIFAQDHNSIYSFLILVQDLSFVLFIVVFVFTLLLLFRQVKIWFFEHSRRIRIMELHGGSIMYSSRPVLVLITLSSILALIITFALVTVGLEYVSLFVQKEIIQYVPTFTSLSTDFIKIAILSFVIPFITYLGLLIKYKLK